MIPAYRTPDDRFADLPDFPWTPRHHPLADGLRMAWVEAGPADGPVVLMLHGEPSWSFLYRHLLASVAGAGMRGIAPDLVGFGRSDKPTAPGDYTYERHVGWLREWFEALDLRDVVLFAQDWGGLVGLRLVAALPDRFAGVVVANTGLPTGDRPPPAALLAWQEVAATMPDFDVGAIVASGCAHDLPAPVRAAYDAPFPEEAAKAGARVFPSLIPTSPDNPSSEPNRAAWAALERFERPFLTAFSDGDPLTRGGERVFHRRIPGAAGQPHVTIPGAGHFLQEDAPGPLAEVVISFAARVAAARRSG